MMNSSNYHPNGMHQEHNVVVAHPQQTHSHQAHSGHTTHPTNMTSAITGIFNPQASSIPPIPAHPQPPQIPLSTISVGTGNTGTHPPVAAAAALFDPRQVQLANALEKTYYTTSAAVVPSSAARYYSAPAVPAVTTTTATNPADQSSQQHHQQGNTILITNNFSAQHQYGGTTPQAAAAVATSPQMQQRAVPSVVGGIPSAGTTSTANYNTNGTASNIRIITTLPNALQQQQQSQHLYNVAKEGDSNVRSDILQLPQFYHTPHQQTSPFAQHLSAILPQHFAQQHFAATTAGAPPLQLPQDVAQQQQQYFVAMADTSDGVPVGTTNLTTAPKFMPTLTGEATTTTAVGTVTTSPSMVSSSATTATSNSTLVLDRINICINNHYSDPLAATNSLSTAMLDSNVAGTTATITSAAHTFATTAHAPQQPSPIIPAIHHKVMLDTVGSGGSCGEIHIDPYASNDSTLVIDEPDSTTTTPHTPPTTPENSSPPPLLPQSLIRTTTTAQIIAVETLSNDKDTLSAQPKLVAAKPTTAKEHAFAAITQSIEVLDDDKSDYVGSDGDNGGSDGWIANTEETFDDDVLEILDDETEFPTPQAMRMNHATNSGATTPPSIITQPQSATDLHDLCIERNVKLGESMSYFPKPAKQTSPQSPILTNVTAAVASEVASSVTLLTPPTPTISPSHPQDSLITASPTSGFPMSSPVISFSMGEDVFIRKDDDRFYLGTVIGNNISGEGNKLQKTQQVQYLIRFDDNSELWCGMEEMRRLGGSTSNRCEQMCVACKRTQQQDVVETCKRCGRGYHRSCTSETSPGSGVWSCLRCSEYDQKQHFNEEQFYCYCGKTGQSDNNMLQCCKCQNWFHTHCMHNFKTNLLRGDGFFVFCCRICNSGVEFVRRLQMNWVDLVHLAIYNLSILKKHQKFHHLNKDILPYIAEKIHTLPVPQEWMEMSETDLLQNITHALKENATLFVSGREGKRDLFSYALRSLGPPISPRIYVQADDVFPDVLFKHRLKLKLYTAPLANSYKSTADMSKASAVQKHKSTIPVDVYEFRIEDNEKFTSDDEIPIKHIIEQVRRSRESMQCGSSPGSAKSKSNKKHSNSDGILCHQISALDDETANGVNCVVPAKQRNVNKILQTPKKDKLKGKDTINGTLYKSVSCIASSKLSAQTSDVRTKINPIVDTTISTMANIIPAVCSNNKTSAIIAERSSRKRKAFTLSNSYKEIAAEAAAKRYDSSRICDSSSDENSSSSRGTSLDVIIPPPKNFLGLNNPFRIVTPKKNASASSLAATGGPAGCVSGLQSLLSFSRGGKVIKNSIFNTNALDFSSKLAALKCAGIFPNLSTSNLAKAAGQPRTVRTIKRRLSAKDITIGPNQEVRRRRTRRLSSNIEVISTTTINPIPSNFFPIHAKDVLSTHIHHTTTPSTATMLSTFNKQQQQLQSSSQQQQQPNIASGSIFSISSSSSASSSPPASVTSSVDSQVEVIPASKPMHGRRLRQRPQKKSPSNSRRSSISNTSTASSTNSSSNITLAALQQQQQQHQQQQAQLDNGNKNTKNVNNTKAASMQDLKQSVKEYFGGAVNRIECGEQFCIRAKRQLANGQLQYLIEWGDVAAAIPLPAIPATTMPTTNTSTMPTTVMQ